MITPVLSAPIYQPRRWVPKTSRPLPNSEEQFDEFNFRNSYEERGSNIDYSNFIQFDRNIKPECFWKYSRVFGSSKKIIKSLNPIKHWRNQLIPRQLFYLDELSSIEILELVDYKDYKNNIASVSRNRYGRLSYIQDYPGRTQFNFNNVEDGSTIDEIRNTLQTFCAPGHVIKNLEKIKNCEKVRLDNAEFGSNSKLCLDSIYLKNSRPGLNTEYNLSLIHI